MGQALGVNRGYRRGQKKRLSATELYSWCVGHGMTPEYFKHHLRPYEAEAFLKGVELAQRAAWEQTRSVMYSNLAPWSKDLKPKDVMEFAWDNERSAADAPSREKMESTRRWAESVAATLSQRRKQSINDD